MASGEKSEIEASWVRFFLLKTPLPDSLSGGGI
jgi:hypothetical protein